MLPLHGLVMLGKPKVFMRDGRCLLEIFPGQRRHDCLKRLQVLPHGQFQTFLRSRRKIERLP